MKRVHHRRGKKRRFKPCSREWVASEAWSRRDALFSFAMKLTNNRDNAEDLVSDTVAAAIANHAGFRPGTNFEAWIFVIMRNRHYSLYRKRKREPEGPDESLALAMECPADQIFCVLYREAMRVVESLPGPQREAFQEVVTEGHGYDAAAVALGIPSGTVKSRVHRARERLRLAGVLPERTRAVVEA